MRDCHVARGTERTACSSESSSSSSSTQALSGIPHHEYAPAQAKTNSRSQQTAMGATVAAMPTPTVLPTATPKAQLSSTSPTKRAAHPTTLDVPPQAKCPRSEGSQVDVRSVTVAGVTIAATEDEDAAEYFDGHAHDGELPTS